ncbi:helix-turn-helix domain-containing protein [Sphingopyxis sp.]|uniref:helix-turn-helix domain-containing protein n=1 Tax=Sphingopyxis sp. TaxID=1908224 RepID=UPI003D0B2342
MTQTTLEIIARNVRLRRHTLGISQEELAERAGLHRTYVGAVERAEKNLTISSLEKLAIGLKTTVASLVAA